MLKIRISAAISTLILASAPGLASAAHPWDVRLEEELEYRQYLKYEERYEEDRYLDLYPYYYTRPQWSQTAALHPYYRSRVYREPFASEETARAEIGFIEYCGSLSIDEYNEYCAAEMNSRARDRWYGIAPCDNYSYRRPGYRVASYGYRCN